MGNRRVVERPAFGQVLRGDPGKSIGFPIGDEDALAGYSQKPVPFPPWQLASKGQRGCTELPGPECDRHVFGRAWQGDGDYVLVAHRGRLQQAGHLVGAAFQP